MYGGKVEWIEALFVVAMIVCLLLCLCKRHFTAIFCAGLYCLCRNLLCQ